MTLKQFQCPSCGANLNIDSESTSVKCEYCGQSFVLDKPVESAKIAEVEKKFGVRTVAITAVFLVVIVIAVVVLVATGTFAPKNEDISSQAEAASTSATENISVPDMAVEKDYYTFRTESARQIAYDKQGADMGFATPEEFEAAANEVIFSADALTRTASDGCRIFYQEATNFFVKLYDDGAIRMFFAPENGKEFFESN